MAKSMSLKLILGILVPLFGATSICFAEIPPPINFDGIRIGVVDSRPSKDLNRGYLGNIEIKDVDIKGVFEDAIYKKFCNSDFCGKDKGQETINIKIIEFYGHNSVTNTFDSAVTVFSKYKYEFVGAIKLELTDNYGVKKFEKVFQKRDSKIISPFSFKVEKLINETWNELSGKCLNSLLSEIANNSELYAALIAPNVPSRRIVHANSENKSAPAPPPNFSYPDAGGSNDSAIAVIIGNRNYFTEGQNVPDVDYAHNDADSIKQYLVKARGYREGNIIDLRDATQANLVSTFGNKDNYKGQLYSWIRPEESDVFIYFSGHGAPGLSNGQGYLLPVDANPNTVELNGYPLETLYANLGKLPAKSLTVVIDACFSGSSQAGSVIKNASAISLKRVEAKTALPNATILTAAGLSEVASWDEEARMGLFTRHFLEGVTGKADQDKFGNGDGQVTLGELKGYLESEVTYMARRLYMREQHPQVSGQLKREMARLN